MTSATRLSTLCRAGMAAAAFATLLAPGFAHAQTQATPGVSGSSWPQRAVRLVLPFPPGAAADAFARPVAPKLAEALGQPFVVENRAGAGGAIGSEFVAKSPPDGHTLLITFATHYALPFFQKAVPYDTVRDFTPVIAAASIHTVLAVHPSHAAKTMSDFLEIARKSAVPVQYGVGGVGSGPHLAGELLSQAAGVKLAYIPYKGGGPMMADLLGGQISAGLTVLSSAIPQVKSGKLRVLAIIADKRAASAPEIPAVTETLPGYALPDIWVGVLGPASLPLPIATRLHAEVNRAMNLPDVREKLAGAGFELTGNLPPQALAESVRRSVDTFRRITAQAGFQPE